MGCRRSERSRVKPIDWWDNETIKYKTVKIEGSIIPVAVIEGVVRNDVDMGLSTKPAKKRSTSHTAAKKIKGEPNRVISTITVENVIDNEKYAQMVEAKNKRGQVERQQLITSQSMIDFMVTPTQFQYAKTQQVDGCSSASTGFMIIPPGGEKPTRNTKDNALTFIVVSGKISVTIHKTTLIVGVATQFNVPAGNQYRLENLGVTECRVFWVCMTPDPDMSASVATDEDEAVEQEEVAST